MKKSYVSSLPLPEFPLWKKAVEGRPLFSFDFDLTARCNNNCRHCYINLPAGDAAAKGRELSLAEIDRIASEAASLGAFWCLLSGGEPLLREDFAEVYLLLKKKGLLVSVFSNAALVGPEHVRLFKAYPPRDVEVSVYGATPETYEKITRIPGSFAAFLKGLDLLLGSGVKVRLKAMALRSNLHEFPAIAAFCRARTKDYFRFDPFLHLRYDGDEVRNAEIRAERAGGHRPSRKGRSGPVPEAPGKVRDPAVGRPRRECPCPPLHLRGGSGQLLIGL
jgi:MoaA/NifB/PqqE/SkfB family radical SAM enzyme